MGEVPRFIPELSPLLVHFILFLFFCHSQAHKLRKWGSLEANFQGSAFTQYGHNLSAILMPPGNSYLPRGSVRRLIKINLPHAMKIRALCGAILVTQHEGFDGDRNRLAALTGVPRP